MKMNDVLKQASKQASKGRIQRTFDIPLSRDGIDEALRKEAELLRREAYAGWSRADLCREAWLEYVTRHSPGNPTIPLTHWTEDEPLSISAQEKLVPTNSHSKRFKCDCGGNKFCLRCGGVGFWFEETK